MTDSLLQSWWVLALRGAVAIAFGVLTFLRPDMTLLAFVLLFSIFALLTGGVSLAGAWRLRKSDTDWLPLLLIGLVGIAAGVIALVHPGLTALVLVLLIAANALVAGVLDIVTAIRLRKTIDNEWLLMLSGLASVLFGVAVFLFPGLGALALIWLISIYALITGILLLALSFRLRSHSKPSLPRKERRMLPDRRRPAHP